MIVRRARPEDGAALGRIDAATWSPQVTPAPRRPDRVEVYARTPMADLLVAEDAGEVVGYVFIRQDIPLPSHTHVLEVAGLAVDPTWQGRGIGRALLEAGAAEARARGARKLTLRVLATNPDAQRLYAACGFAVEGVLRGEFVLDGAAVDDVLMALAL